jgi:hypothetical protein
MNNERRLRGGQDEVCSHVPSSGERLADEFELELELRRGPPSPAHRSSPPAHRQAPSRLEHLAG